MRPLLVLRENLDKVRSYALAAFTGRRRRLHRQALNLIAREALADFTLAMCVYRPQINDMLYLNVLIDEPTLELNMPTVLNAADDFDGLYRYGPTPQEAAAAAAAAAAPAAEAAQAVKAAKAAKATQKACVAAEAAAEATASAAALAKRAATRAAARVRRRQRGSLAAQRLCAAKRLQHAYHVFVYNKRVHKLREFAHAIQFTVRQRRQFHCIFENALQDALRDVRDNTVVPVVVDLLTRVQTPGFTINYGGSCHPQKFTFSHTIRVRGGCPVPGEQGSPRDVNEAVDPSVDSPVQHNMDLRERDSRRASTEVNAATTPGLRSHVSPSVLDGGILSATAVEPNAIRSIQKQSRFDKVQAFTTKQDATSF